MTEDRLARLGPLAGLLFVVLELGGVIVGSAGGRAMVTLGDSSSKIVAAFADPVGIGVWIGAYMELLAVPAFAVFAVWLFRSRRGMLSTTGLLGVASYLAVITLSLVIGDVLEYRAGHGLGAQTALALFDLQAGLYAVSWGIAGGILFVAPATGWLRRTALALAALSFVGMAVPKAAPGQVAAMLFFVWVLAASVTPVLRARAAGRAVPARRAATAAD
jgi:hypothetical protein